jgi:hypothetical protein
LLARVVSAPSLKTTRRRRRSPVTTSPDGLQYRHLACMQHVRLERNLHESQPAQRHRLSHRRHISAVATQGRFPSSFISETCNLMHKPKNMKLKTSTKVGPVRNRMRTIANFKGIRVRVTDTVTDKIASMCYTVQIAALRQINTHQCIGNRRDALWCPFAPVQLFFGAHLQKLVDRPNDHGKKSLLC